MLKRLLIAAAALLLASQAQAADCWNNAAGTQTDCGVVPMYLNSSSQAVPVSPTSPLPVTNSGSGANLGVPYFATAALAANKVVKASPGNLYGFQVSADTTLSAAAWWIMVYDATSAPVDGAVTPIKCYALPAGTTSLAASWPTPLVLATGITIGVSTNGCFTKAASTHAFISGDAQ